MLTNQCVVLCKTEEVLINTVLTSHSTKSFESTMRTLRIYTGYYSLFLFSFPHMMLHTTFTRFSGHFKQPKSFLTSFLSAWFSWWYIQTLLSQLHHYWHIFFLFFIQIPCHNEKKYILKVFKLFHHMSYELLQTVIVAEGNP